MDPLGTPFPVTVIVNHLRSLSGIDGTDGERIRAKRQAQAEFLAALIQAHQATERVISDRRLQRVRVQRRLRRRRRHRPRNADAGRPGRACKRGPRRSGSDESRRCLDPSRALLVRIRWQRAGARSHPGQQPRAQAIHARRLRSQQRGLPRIAARRWHASRARCPITTRRLRISRSRLRRSSRSSAARHWTSRPSPPSPILVPRLTTTRVHWTVTTSGTVDVNTPGDYTLMYSATNGYLTTTITRVVRVQDTIAPEMTALRLTPDLLSPANHRLVDVLAAYAASDASGTPSCALYGLEQRAGERPRRRKHRSRLDRHRRSACPAAGGAIHPRARSDLHRDGLLLGRCGKRVAASLRR